MQRGDHTNHSQQHPSSFPAAAPFYTGVTSSSAQSASMEHHQDPAVYHAPAASYLHQPAPASPSRMRFFQLPRSSTFHSTTGMGQTQSQSPSDARGQSPPLPPTPTAEALPAQPARRLGLAWPGRRKKSVDLNTIQVQGRVSPAPLSARGKGKELARQESMFSNSDCESPSGSVQSHDHHSSPACAARQSTSAKQITLQFASNTLHMLKGKLNASSSSVQSPTSPPPPSPPPLPPKPASIRLSTSNENRSFSDTEAPPVTIERGSKRASLSPPPAEQQSAIVTEVEARNEEAPPQSQLPEDDVKAPRRREREHQTAREIVEDWRKSDSTLRTVRLVGSRTPRPLSLAESTNSGSTVQPTASPPAAAGLSANKRLSALMTDADFGMPEVESEDEESDFGEGSATSAYASMQDVREAQQQQQASGPFIDLYTARSRSPSPPSLPSKAGLRRGSLAMHLGRLSPSKSAKAHAAPAPDHLSGGSDSEAHSHVSSFVTHGARTPSSSTTSVSLTSSPGSKDGTLSHSAGEGTLPVEIATVSSTGSDASYVHQYRSGEPWAIAQQKASASSISLSTSNSSHSHMEPTSPPPLQSALGTSPSRPAPQRTRLASIQAKGFRQTAVSLTTGLAPAAGFARGFGRAVDKLGRALGGSATNLTNLSGGVGEGYYPPQSPTENIPAPGSGASFFGMGRSQSHQAIQPGGDAQYLGHGLNAGHGHGHGHGHRHGGHAKKVLRRGTPNATSGTWSIGSGTASSMSDSEGAHPAQTPGPNLGMRVRGPLRPNGGLVFGQDLAQCVRETAIDAYSTTRGRGEDGGATEEREEARAQAQMEKERERLEKKRRRSSHAFVMDMEVVGAPRALAGRRLPALVTRCAQHIEKWGVQEEGLFRISGRSTHMAKLRAEFDSGADYDMNECGPGEIDPHAVASIFKAYLRELPEPILTRTLIPYFEAALSAENSMTNSSEGGNGSGIDFSKARAIGLPSRPKGGMPIHKAPSLSTFAVPTLTPRAPSESLLKALSALIARLPVENRDLLRTTTELMKATARRSKETKMPLSNLLLVFCPSMMMSPPLLRVLCEGEGIWDGAPKGAPDPIVVDIRREEMLVDIRGPSPVGESEDEGAAERACTPDDEGEHADGEHESGLRSQRTIRRAAKTSNNISEDASKQDVTSLIESTPESSPSSEQLSLNMPNDNSTSPDYPLSAGAQSKTDSPFSAPYNLYSPPPLTGSSESLSTPPSSGSGSPVKPPSLALLPTETIKPPTVRAQSDLPSPSAKGSIRKSLIGNPIPFPMGLGGSAPVTPIELATHVRLSTYSTSSPNLSPTAPAIGMRRKSKASLQSLFPKRSLSSLLGRSNGPESPGGFETAPQSRVVSACPVLELPVDIHLSPMALGLDLDDPEFDSKATGTVTAAKLGPGLEPASVAMSRASSGSSAITSSVFYTPPSSSHAAPSLASDNSTGSYSLLDFDLNKDVRSSTDDWARSVLQAADAEPVNKRKGSDK